MEAFRALFQQHSFSDGWTQETIGGLWDRQGRHYIVFDVDATRQAARQRALPCDPTLPAAKRRLDAVCAPGYTGRKRGEVVRTRTATLQMHTRQWVGTNSGRGNGDYREELSSARHSITTYLKHFALPAEVALVRLDGHYADAAVVAQLMRAGVHLVTRGRGYHLLEHPQIQGVLAHSPIAKVTAITTGEVVELFDGGWLPPYRGLPAARGMVARHPAPPPDKAVRVGKRIGEWVYELFITTAFCRWVVFPRISWTSIMDVEPKIAVLADEDIEVDPDRWCSYTECGQELWQIACQWVWNLRLSLGHAMQGAEIREIEWVPPKERPALISPSENTQEAYGPWQWAADAGRGRGRRAGEAFSLQEDGTLQGPTGAFLWLSELRQENAFTQRAVYVASASRLSSMYSA